MMKNLLCISAILVLLQAVPVHAQTCMDENTCTGSSYAVKKDFTMMNPADAPSSMAGATTGGFCNASETYRTYVAWCNESGCTAMSPASGDVQPSSGTTNLISVTRPAIPSEATSWAAYFSKASESHLKIRHCTSSNPTAGTVEATATTDSCKCFPFGGQQQTGNQTGIVQMSSLTPDGSVKLSAKDGTVQGKLTTDKSILEYTSDLVPRLSPDGGTTFRTVDWNSATVFYVEPNFGESKLFGRSVFSSITNAMLAITDSSYARPYVLKVRNNGGAQITGATINKPYVWLQGDGATRVGPITVMADGVRVSGLITHAIIVGVDSVETSPSDLDNIWVTGNIVTNGPQTALCKIWVHVGGGTRTHAVFVSNNRLGSSKDPASIENDCFLAAEAGDPGKGTVVTFSENYVESHKCVHQARPLVVAAPSSGSTTGHMTLSMRNTFVCNAAAGINEPGEDYACISSGFAFGTLRSIDDTCILTRTDSGPYSHRNLFMNVDQNYADTVPRSTELINPTFIVNLPAAHFAGDSIAYFLMDTPYLSFSVSNPRYREAALGSGWSASDKHFAVISGARPWSPSASNTFLRWDNVLEAPGSDIQLVDGATAGSIDAGPSHRVMKEAFGPKLILAGVDLGSTCRENEFRYDTGGSTKELCLCDASGAWKCKALGPLQD